MRQVAVPALAVLLLGAGPGQVSNLAFAASIPTLVVALPVGVLINRYPLPAVLVTTNVVAAVFAAGIPVAATLDELTMTHLYMAALALGALSALYSAAAMDANRRLAGAGRLHRANSLYTATITTAGFSGTALGTILVSAVGPVRALAADAVSRLVSALCAVRLRGLSAKAGERAGRRPVLTEISEGLSHCARDPLLRPLCVALALTSVGAGLTATLLAYHLLTTVRTGTTGLGVIMAASSLGGLTGALAAPRLAERYGAGPVLVTAFTLHGLLQIPVLLADPGPAWLIVLAIAGFGQFAAATCTGTTQRTVQQEHTPPHLCARVQQTTLWLCNGTTPLAALAAGGLAALVSVRTVMALGVLILLLPAWVLWRSPVGRLGTTDSGGAA
ncbi:MFS transporter [Streptomyces californicus]|uniref:MFS transporter n=1 Tax=Streptomyces californicus TaxID=67351 RepID=UPI0033F7699F